MHVTRTYMPPFPGNDSEAEAMIAYFKELQNNQELIFGAQARWSPKAVNGGQTSGSP